jgi:NADPH2:quinone reductase
VPTDVDEPVAGAGHVAIDVAFANITFVETQIRSGRVPNPAMVPELPFIPGNGVGGTTANGSRVVASTGGRGAYAERVVVDRDALIDVPRALDLDIAVALLADGRTALMLAEAAEIRRGDTVLVHAAAGGVGWLLVQLAWRHGARVVIGAAGSERKLARVREIADVAVDYTRPDWTRAAGSADVVFDGVGGRVGREAMRLLAPGGRFVAYGFASGDFTGPDRELAATRGIEIRGLDRPSAD